MPPQLRYLAILVCALLMTACSSSTGTGTKNSDPILTAKTLPDLMKAGLAEASSDYEREIFTKAVERGALTQADYDESMRLYGTCMSDAGYDITFEATGTGTYTEHLADLPAGEDQTYIDAGSKCAMGIYQIIPLVYSIQVTNPGFVDDVLVYSVNCLIENQLVGPDFTIEELNIIFDNNFENSPFDIKDATVKDCLAKGNVTLSFAD